MDRLFNCHTHIFNIDHAPERFLQGFVSKKIAKIAWFFLQLPLGRKLAAKLVARVKNPNVSKYASFVYVGTMKSQNHVYRDLRSNYSYHDSFVILTLNMDYMGAGDPASNYSQQIYEMKRVKKNNPDTCLPFYSVDPRAGTDEQNAALAEEHIKNKGFAGIKIYPALGFYPFDKGMESTYRFAKDHKVPIMTHCTRVGSYYLGELTPEMIDPDPFCEPPKNWPQVYSRLNFPIEADLDDNAAFCDNFSYPYNYSWVLEQYPDLKICFAHAGDDPEIIKARNDLESHLSWFTHIKFLMETYENVYTDISFTLSENKVFEDLYNLISNPKYKKKVLFGTDYFMTLMKKKEKPLVEDFRKFLFKKDDGAELWRNITHENPREYLRSDFYTP